jgi:hypothetical protein
MMRLAVQQLETILYKDLLFFTEFSEQSPAELGFYLLSGPNASLPYLAPHDPCDDESTSGVPEV